jgi:NAD(P)-dependent dehydrogenase (short-subunit alcohol dehydrogenase family)
LGRRGAGGEPEGTKRQLQTTLIELSIETASFYLTSNAGMSSIKNKLIAITGAASGIGRATAQLLASHGAILSLADANEESLQHFESELKKEGVDVITQKVDVRVRTEVDNWIGKTVEHFSKPLDGNRPTLIEILAILGEALVIRANILA